MNQKKTQRIDQLLVQKQLAVSRERAQSYIMAGLVYVNGKPVQKASEKFSSDAEVELKGQDHPYVSRGGVKLEGALQDFQIEVLNKVCLDVGASTGGFTDCLLQKGASKVYAVDVGYGQLAWKLRQDARVILKEKTHVKDLKKEDFQENIDLVVLDVSFISILKVIPYLLKILEKTSSVLALIKPQFEAGKEEVPRGGIIRDENQRKKIVDKTLEGLKGLGIDIVGLSPSKLQGMDGNQEYFVLLERK